MGGRGGGLVVLGEASRELAFLASFALYKRPKPEGGLVHQSHSG
jgi:hypothetical protein